MKVSAVKVFNIRSFLDNDNYLMLEDNKTAIIGINESGKSNILEAIGNLNFRDKLGNYYNNIKNLSTPEEDVQILVELYLKDDELKQLNVADDSEKTLLTFKVGEPTKISGTLSHVISQNRTINRFIEFWENHEVSEFYNITNANRDLYYNAIQLVKRCSGEIIKLNQLDILNKNLKKDVATEECINCVSDLRKELSNLYSLFPIILYKKSNGVIPIKSAYINTDAIKELADSTSSLYKLTSAAGIEIDEMIKAFELPEGNARQTLRYKVEKSIKENVCEKFKEFYAKSDLDIIIKFEANKLLVNVITGGMVMSISERSNGLRWYFGLFIELMMMDYQSKDVLYLLDEPGVFLHVNAQKELLTLFDQLCDNNGQLIYTTHLPYMLDAENIYCIRRVEKDDNGQSHIFNRAYSGGIELPSRQETLTPLIKAMGCDMKHSIEMFSRNNIVTEGITDRMYLEAGIKSLGVIDDINIIPSNGASAIPNIVSILIGWGCDYKVVLDYDKEGFTQYKRLVNSFGEEVNDKIVFIADGYVPDDVNDRTIATKTIEWILSDNDSSKLETPYDGTDKTKTISAMEFRSKVMNGEIIIDEITTDGFLRLFRKLGITK